MGSWFGRVDELVLILLFVVVPILQRIAAVAAKRRREAVAKERIRRREEGTQVPMALEHPEPEVAPADTLTELLESMSDPIEEDQEVLVDSFTAEFEPAPIPVAPPVAPPVVHPALATPLVLSATPEFSGSSGAASGDLLAAGGLAKPFGSGRLVDLPVFESREADEALSDFRAWDGSAASLRPDDDPREPQGTDPGIRRASTDWRRAVVLAEALAPPVALRGPEGSAPGLDL